MDKFHYEANGYNREEVNEFVRDVIRETEGAIERIKNQNAEIEALKKDLEHYRELDKAMNNVMLKAEETRENIKKMALEESDIIIADAKNNASRIVNEALLKAEKIDNERETLERNMNIFKKKLRIILEQQMAVVEEIEVLELDPE